MNGSARELELNKNYLYFFLEWGFTLYTYYDSAYWISGNSNLTFNRVLRPKWEVEVGTQKPFIFWGAFNVYQVFFSFAKQWGGNLGRQSDGTHYVLNYMLGLY